MWFWITISAFFLLLIIVEESIYYLWNRNVYGPNGNTPKKWWKRITNLLTFLNRKHHSDSIEMNKEKSSH